MKHLSNQSSVREGRVGIGLAMFTICSADRSRLMDAREHLRYWPFVKEFREIEGLQSLHALRVTIFVGQGLTREQWQHDCKRGIQLMSLCLKQHRVSLSPLSLELTYFRPSYSNSEFLRPDDLLQPMSNFINDSQL